jgi:hypothetical protein
MGDFSTKNPVSGHPPTKETGFFTESAGDNQVFRKKTRFLATRQLRNRVFTDLSVATKYAFFSDS